MTSIESRYDKLEKKFNKFAARESRGGFAEAYMSFMTLASLRAFWPFSSTYGSAYDISGQGRTLTNNGSITTTQYGPAVYGDLNGSSQYWSRADEAGLEVGGVGLTLGGWFRFDALGTANLEGLIGKHNATGDQRSYGLILNSSSGIRFQVSSDGTSVSVSQIDSSGTLVVNTWYFIVGTWEASTRISIWINGVETYSTSSVVATSFDSTAAFEIGRRNIASSYVNGQHSFCFLCGRTHPEADILRLFNATRWIFGV